MSNKVYVIGAGVIGLSTALRIYERCPGVTVTIIADRFTPDTTGDGAGGTWQPHMMGETPIRKLREWGQNTFNHLKHLATQPEASNTGNYFVTGYDIFHEDIGDPFWHDQVIGYRRMTREELAPYPGNKFGYQYTTMVAEGPKYLPWLMSRLKEKGCHFIKRKVNSLDEFEEADILVNCTGVGARELIGDQNVQPMKGQLIRAKAPWVKYFINADDDDLTDKVVMGGTHLLGDGTMNVDEQDKRRIYEGCCKLIPSLKNAEVIDDWVGLRPSRPSVRLELEMKQNKRIVHNYGHGGGGITLHWGCALEAADMVKQALDYKSKL